MMKAYRDHHPVGKILRPSALALVTALTLLWTAPLCAASPAREATVQDPATPAEARKLVRTATTQPAPAFKTVYSWRKKEKKEEKKEWPWLDKLFRWLQQHHLSWLDAEFLALMGRLLVLGLVALGVAFALIQMQRQGVLDFFRRPPQTGQAPEVLFGLDLRPESLPASPADASLALFAAGRAREALALLYRAALSRCIHDWQIPLAPSMTELECERVIAERGPAPQSACLRQLTASWIRLAYGHEALAETHCQELAQGFREAFG